MKKTIILIGIIGLICICGLFLFVNHASGVTLNCYTDLIYSEKDDVAIYNYDKDYSKCRNAAVGNDFSPGAETVIGQTLDSGWYSTFRLFEWFDTSSIPDTAVITGWYFYFASSYTYGMMDYIDIIDGSSFELPPVLEDYNISGYNLTVGGELSGYLAFFEPDTYLVIGSNVDGVGFINKTGMTKFVLMSHNDFDGIPDYSDNRGFIYMNEGSYPPILVVYYTLDYVECGSTDLTVISNLVNCTVTNQSSYNSATGWTTWINGTSPLAWFFNIANMTITHENSWDGANQNLYVNGTGNTTALTLFENFINAYGTHEYNLGPGGLSVWANVTGTGGGSTGATLLVDNPNPANNSINQTGMYLNNNLSNNPLGLDCAVDVQYQNMTNLSEHFMSGGEESVSYVGDYYVGQTFNITGDTITLDKVGFKILNLPGAGNLTSFFITGTCINAWGNVIPNESDVLCVLPDIDVSTLSIGWDFIDMPNIVLNHGVSYAFLMNWTNEGLYPSYLFNISLTLGDYFPPPVLYVDIYPYGSHCWYAVWLPGWIAYLSDDMYFWLWPVNYSWNNIINLTYKWSPNNVDWYQFGKVNALWNGTWSVFNANFTNASTTYYWSVTPEINGTLYPEQFYTFTTGNPGLIATAEDHRILYLGIGGTLGGVLTMVCIPYIFVRRRDRRQDEYN